MRIIPLLAISTAGLLLAFSTQALALNEGDAVKQALRNSTFQQILSAREQQAQGESRATGRWFNPEISYERESLDVPGGESRETTLSLSQRFNLAGIKRLERSAARHHVDAEAARNTLLKRERVAQTRAAFYQALMAEQHYARLDALYSDLNQLSTSIQARAEAGDASRYDAMRIAREVAIYAGRRLQLGSHLQAEKGRLEVLTGADASTLEGALLPRNDVTPSEEADLALHPLIAAYDAQVSRASTQATAAGRQRWPDMTLSLGRKDVDEPGFETDGHVVALGMELPIGSNGKHQAAASRSRADLLEAERQLAVQQLQAEHTAYIEQFQANKRASETLARHGGDSDASEEGALVTTARAAYNAGEISIMALLDAYRADYELQERRLEHALAARQAYIQWQQLTGK